MASEQSVPEISSALGGLISEELACHMEKTQTMLTTIEEKQTALEESLNSLNDEIETIKSRQFPRTAEYLEKLSINRRRTLQASKQLTRIRQRLLKILTISQSL
ncbi:hypothetical protein PCE1_001490 [Barthelona sp. PCE]